MRAFLLFLSSLAFFLCGQASRYQFEIETEKAFVSGIMIVHSSDDEIRGEMFNEFGISVLGFTFDCKKDKVKLHGVMGFLNKWYIKAVLKNDIRIALHSLYDIPLKKTPKGYVIENDINGCKIMNLKRDIKYSFYPLKIEPNEAEE